MAPREPLGNGPIIHPNISGTNIPNTPEGVEAFTQNITAGVLMRERDRVAANARRARGDYGIELGDADEALRLINRLEFPDDDFDAATETIARAIQMGFKGGYLPDDVADRLDAMVNSFNTYTSELLIQLQNLAETAYILRHGKASDE